MAKKHRYQAAFILHAFGRESGVYTGYADTLGEFFVDLGLHVERTQQVACQVTSVKIIESDGIRVSIHVDDEGVRRASWYLRMVFTTSLIQNAVDRDDLRKSLREMALGKESDDDQESIRWSADTILKLERIQSPRLLSLLDKLLDWLLAGEKKSEK